MTKEEIIQGIEHLQLLRKREQFEEGKVLAYKILEQPLLQEDIVLLEKVINLLGVFYKNLSDYAKALECFSKALQISEEIGNKNNIVVNLVLIGLVYNLLSDYKNALLYSEKAFHLNEETGNKQNNASNLGNIGVIYWNLAEYNKSLEYLEKALQLNIEIDNKIGIAADLGNIALVYSSLSDTTKAIEFHKKSLIINKDINNKVGLTNNYSNLGKEYTELSDFPTALEYLENALLVNEEIGNKNGKGYNLINIGRIYGRLSEYSKAIEFLNQALHLTEEIGARKAHLGALKELSELYEKTGDIPRAFSLYKQAIALDKEIQSEESANKARIFDQQRKIEEDERARQLKLARFQEQEKILLNILPAEIAERILEGEKRIADMHEHVSVFFSDIVGFTKISQTISPDDLVIMLNEIFSEFDRIARKHGLEKIKTIGDAYMAVAGVPLAQEDHAQRAANFALEVIEYMKVYRKKSNSDLQIRVGLHCGRAIAGVIGENKFAYDLWGDSVNTASRMESHGEAGRIHVSEDFRNVLSASNFNFIERGEMEVKGKGKMKTYFLECIN